MFNLPLLIYFHLQIPIGFLVIPNLPRFESSLTSLHDLSQLLMELKEEKFKQHQIYQQLYTNLRKKKKTRGKSFMYIVRPTIRFMDSLQRKVWKLLQKSWKQLFVSGHHWYVNCNITKPCAYNTTHKPITTCSVKFKAVTLPKIKEFLQTGGVIHLMICK